MSLDNTYLTILSHKIKGSTLSRNRSPYSFSSKRGSIVLSKNSTASSSIHTSITILIHSNIFSSSFISFILVFLSFKITLIYCGIISFK